MLGLEVGSSNVVCRKCGTAYGRNKGYFLVSHGELYKGAGYLPYCKNCVEEIFQKYINEDGIELADAVRQVCRKLDIYWNEQLFNIVEKVTTTRSIMTTYIAKVNSIKYAGKSYDDTLKEEGVLWVWPSKYGEVEPDIAEPEAEEEEEIDIPEDVVLFWGPGYKNSMYRELEDRRKYWISRYPDDYQFDVGEEALIRQICNLEIDINHDRAAGKSIDKNVNTLNNILGSANLKPTQKKGENDSELEKMPLGVGIQKWEFYRPLPETEKKKRDIRGIVKNVTTWYLGHACKMVGLKNSYTKLYEDAMEELRVNRPEYDDEDDDTLLSDIFGGTSGDGGPDG